MNNDQLVFDFLRNSQILKFIQINHKKKQNIKHMSSQSSFASLCHSNNQNLPRNSKNIFALLLATFIDCPQIIYPEQISRKKQDTMSILKSQKGGRKMNVLQAYQLINWYEKKYERVYPQPLKFYIMAALLDHKLVSLYGDGDGETGCSQVGWIQNQAAPWIVFNIEVLEQQYYRESMAWKKLNNSFEGASKDRLGYKLFEILDKQCCGYIKIGQVIKFIEKNGGYEKLVSFSEQKSKLIHKFCQNVYNFQDLHHHTSEPRNMIYIQNFMELIGRVQETEPFSGIYECKKMSLTFHSIAERLEELKNQQVSRQVSQNYQTLKSITKMKQSNYFKDTFLAIKKTSRQMVQDNRQNSIPSSNVNTVKKESVQSFDTQQYFFATRQKLRENGSGRKQQGIEQISFRTLQTPKVTARVPVTFDNNRSPFSLLLLSPKNFQVKIDPSLHYKPKPEQNNPLKQKIIENVEHKLQDDYEIEKALKKQKRKVISEKIQAEMKRVQIERIKNQMKAYKILFSSNY